MDIRNFSLREVLVEEGASVLEKAAAEALGKIRAVPKPLLIVLSSLFLHGLCLADVAFVPRELFHVPFGSDRAHLGTKAEGENLQLPADFTRDAVGRFYIYDRVNHRIARFSPVGAFEIGYRFPPTARQVFAHADERQNLWLLVADPARGVFYGVYDQRGKALRSATLAQYNRFRLHVGDDFSLRAMLSHDARPGASQLFRFDSQTMLMTKETIALPPETHHRVKKGDVDYFVDQVPGSSNKEGAVPVNRITDRLGGKANEIEGQVVYVTDAGDLYTRVGAREIRIYDVRGVLKGKVTLSGLSFTLASIRFDGAGNIYQLDGIPDKTDEDLRKEGTSTDRRNWEDRHYTSGMPGMRMILWERRR
jgi:hypothetical protein